MRYIVYLAVCVGCFFVGLHWKRQKVPIGDGDVKVLMVRDTVRLYSQVPVYIKVKEHVEQALPLAGTETDTAVVVVPMEQAVYESEDYRAYVSGYRPNLDSLVLKRPVAVVSIGGGNGGQRRFSIGIQAGVGITPAGFQPYLGVGLSYRIL